ncbi:MAG: transposase [Euryarchaeota archaeon]|nr:transposase [Euryarchaeota archaeon]
MPEEIRTVTLNVLPLTKAKEDKLSALLCSCIQATEHILAAISYLRFYKPALSRYDLQAGVYNHLRHTFAMPAQIAIDLIKDVFANNDSDNYTNTFSQYSISYNAPRSGKLTKSRGRGNPVMGITVATGERRMGIPIAQDGAWTRFNNLIDEGYTWSAFKLNKTEKGWRILVSIKREVAALGGLGQSVIGVDVGSRTLAAVTVLTEQGVTRQLYFGRDLYDHQRDISLRRGILQRCKATGSDKEKAKRKLSELKKREQNYVKTRCYQIAHELVALANEHNAVIAIENLSGLKNAKGHRKSNRRVKRMPYNIFRAALESVAKRAGRFVLVVSPRYTSKWCPVCGRMGTRVNKGKTFNCSSCGRVVNADRNASLNIALRAADICDHKLFGSLFSQGYESVSTREWLDEGSGIMSWHGYYPPDSKPLCFSLG